jgi:hypothetical protein
MTTHRTALIDPDDKPESARWVTLPVGVTEREALAIARRVVWPLHRDAVVAERMRHTLNFLQAHPEIDRALADLVASPEGMEALEEALDPYRCGYSHSDPVSVPTQQADHEPEAHLERQQALRRANEQARFPRRWQPGRQGP